MTLFPNFSSQVVHTSGGPIFTRSGGSGPPLLLLHGYPQTHAMWHQVAPLLATSFTVVCADLLGYGASAKPAGDPDHANYSKRATAALMVEVMQEHGFPRFMVAGHDRGGRVTHRLCLDHPDRVLRGAVLDIVPTRTVFRATDMTLATGYYHWFFLAQPAPLPERLIGGDPLAYLRSKLTQWSGSGLGSFAPEALVEYERAFADPATVHASCEDYRAAATIDLVHDEADLDLRIACPLLVLWGSRALMHRRFDVLATWRERARDVTGQPLDCGHFLPEERPEETAGALGQFFAG